MNFYTQIRTIIYTSPLIDAYILLIFGSSYKYLAIYTFN